MPPVSDEAAQVTPLGTAAREAPRRTRTEKAIAK